MMFMNKTKKKQDFRVRRGCRHICSYRSRRVKFGLTLALACRNFNHGVRCANSERKDGVQQRFNKSKCSERPLHTQGSFRLVRDSPVIFSYSAKIFSSSMFRASVLLIETISRRRPSLPSLYGISTK